MKMKIDWKKFLQNDTVRDKNDTSNINVSDIDWLRNDYYHDIFVQGFCYPTVEHAFQASKTSDQNLKRKISEASIRDARKIGRNCNIIPGWDLIKENVMEIILREKFKNPLLGERLARIGTGNIVMNGYDKYWGVIDGEGDNIIGKILMRIRGENRFILGVFDKEEYNLSLLSDNYESDDFED